jgi:hypothetical protein
MMKPNSGSVVPMLATIYGLSLALGGALAATRIKKSTALSPSQPGGASISLGVPYSEDNYSPYGSSGTPGGLLFNTTAYPQASSPTFTPTNVTAPTTFNQPTLAALSSTSGQAFSAMA